MPNMRHAIIKINFRYITSIGIVELFNNSHQRIWGHYMIYDNNLHNRRTVVDRICDGLLRVSSRKHSHAHIGQVCVEFTNK